MRRKEAFADLSRVLRYTQPGTLAQTQVGAAPDQSAIGPPAGAGYESRKLVARSSEGALLWLVFRPSTPRLVPLRAMSSSRLGRGTEIKGERRSAAVAAIADAGCRLLRDAAEHDVRVQDLVGLDRDRPLAAHPSSLRRKGVAPWRQ